MERLLCTFDEDIPILVERQEEDPESVIERSYQLLMEKQRQDKLSDALSEDTKTFIEKVIGQHLETKSKRDNYYEHELIKCYKARVKFLENQVKEMSEIIRNFTSNISNNSSSTKFTKVKSEHSFVPIFNTPNATIATPIDITLKKESKMKHQKNLHEEIIDVNPNGETEQAKRILKDQLVAIRIEKHNNFIKQKSVIKTTKAKDTSSKSRIYVCGDSIVNGLENNGLSDKNHSTNVKSFSGATSIDMIDFIKPIATKKPDAIVLHIGTNDISKSIINTGENIQRIIDHIKETSPVTEVLLSNICHRGDKTIYKEMVKDRNKEIFEVATSNNLRLIDNHNIDDSCLTKKKLHLNRKGFSRLAINMKHEICRQS